ncbi:MULTISPECIES: response regulator transcription factor [Rhodomicrobium]|uniref:response regulator transcription factor n=1 Tax=Rhodomicrobium TaxID=1068 RepID=UPI000B4B6D61|nr:MULTISPECIES: response regulator transcription factor [Rhodomicrobium]
MLGSRALLVEDHARMARLLADYLGDAGFCVTATRSAEEFGQFASVGSFDFYIIDLGLPDGDGIDLVRNRRAASDATPILIITARVSLDDRIRAFDVGADDCLVKPFHASELIARARAILRRPRALEHAEISAGALAIDCSTGDVRAHGVQLKLRRVEQRLLSVLARKLGNVVSKETLESALYDFSKEVTPNAIEQGISRLRSELRRADTGMTIRTVWGAGYALEEAG